MRRVLIVLRGALDREALRQRYAAVANDGADVAVCLVLPNDASSLRDGLQAQRDMTSTLRDVLGESAEDVAVLVASDEDGYGVADCAREWGATEVDS
jgi:hypothetical protein